VLLKPKSVNGAGKKRLRDAGKKKGAF